MSQYIFRGSLRAFIRGDCRDVIPGAQVLLYRHRDDQNVDEMVAERSKHTFTVLSGDAIAMKQRSLIATATTGDDGAFRFELGPEQDYGGGPFEVDVRLTTVKGADPDKKHQPIQFTVTSLQPEWEQKDEGVYEAPPWHYSIAARYWCYILMKWGVWVICGRVFATGTAVPLQGMTVRAYDRDWIQDDLLGQDVTAGGGWFFIYYTAGTFKQTPFSPWLNVEMTSGPDVYFDVEDSGGTLVLDEKPSEGRKPGRENVGHCFCVNLEVGEEAPYHDPLFDHVGNFHIITDIDSTTGRARWTKDGAGGTDWGFTGRVKLRGFCPKRHPATDQPMYYRFQYVDPVTSAVTPVTGNLLESVLVGSKLVQWDVNSDTVLEWTSQSIRVAGSGATPPVSGGSGPVPEHVIVPDAEGWIAVDQDAVDDGFYGPLIRLRTRKIVTGNTSAETDRAAAGSAPAVPKNGALVELIYETTTDKVAIDTQPQTVTLLINNWHEMRALDLQEFRSGSAGGCTGLTTSLTIHYTVDHEVIDSWHMTMHSAASGWSQPAGLPSGSTPRGGFGTHSVSPPPASSDVSSWPPCSYTVRLHARRALTDGENNDHWNYTPLTFCKI